jgi:predicted  nucleic acid-binding Zn-ribbon protein
MTHGRDTVVQCTDCGSIYAAYYTAEAELVTPGGEYCPNCDNQQFMDLPAQDE